MYAMDRRKLAIHVYSLFPSYRIVAKIINVSHSTVGRWLKNPNRKKYIRKSVKSVVIVDILKTTIAANPFITVRQFESIIKETLNISVSRELIRIIIKRMGQTKKKAKFFAVPKHLEERTRSFVQRRNKYVEENRNIVSLDETSFGRYSKPVYGYAPKGKQLIVSKKTSTKSKATSVVVVINKNGIVKKETRLGAYNKFFFVFSPVLKPSKRFCHSS